MNQEQVKEKIFEEQRQNQASIESLSRDPDVNARNAFALEQGQQISLQVLLSVGATTQDIMNYCDGTSSEILEGEFSQTSQTVKQRPDSKILNYLINIRKISLSDFFEIDQGQEIFQGQNIFLKYIERRASNDIQKDFVEIIRSSEEKSMLLLPLLNDIEVLQKLKEKAVTFDDSLQIKILKTFIQNQVEGSELGSEKIAFFLENFLTQELVKRQQYDFVNTLLQIPHREELIKKIKDLENRTLPEKKFFVTTLHDAVLRGNIEEKVEDIKFLAELGFDLDANDQSLAYTAVRNGDLNSLKLLAEYGATLDEKNEFNERPIHEAIKEGNAEIFDYLLERKIRTEDERSAFSDYVIRPIKTAGAFLHGTINVALSPLMAVPITIGLYNSRPLTSILKEIGDSSFVYPMSLAVRDSDPLLTVQAAKYGRVDFLKTLLELGLPTPFMQEVSDTEIRKILDAGERAEEIAKSITSVIKESPEAQIEEGQIDKLEITIRINLLKEYKFDANRMAEDFGLRQKTLFEKLTPHFFRRTVGHVTAANDLIKKTANGVLGSVIDSEEGLNLKDILFEESEQNSVSYNPILEGQKPSNDYVDKKKPSSVINTIYNTQISKESNPKTLG